ncbi:MAG TPA: transporter substrate-binding domain-containing protein [Candidatus Gastranaerophilaceae bacterium]|nr:transporter substrate-binding domain-containing protein [Candidatus Gastranaerophilaceae bacterium]
MKRQVIYIFLLGLVIFFSGCKKQDETSDVLDKVLSRGKLIVGVKFDTKPFGYIDEKQNLTGFDVDLAKHIAKNLLGSEDKIEFKQVTPSNRILTLNSGQVDMIIATMTITDERKEVIDFSKPYYMAGQAILVPAKSDIGSMADLNGKRVIIIFGSTAEKNTRLMAPEAKISGYKTYTNGYSALKQGRADAITSDDTILMGFAMQDDSVKLLPKRYSKEPYAIGFKKGESSTRLRQRVDLILDEMIKSGQLNKLKAKWIKY